MTDSDIISQKQIYREADPLHHSVPLPETNTSLSNAYWKDWMYIITIT